MDENLTWLEHIYDKMGNQISIQPMGYMKVKRTEKSLGNPQLAEFEDDKYKAFVRLNVTNHGTSDQIHTNIILRL